MKTIKKLSWIINNECNLRCIHCYPNSGMEYKEPFNDDDFKKIYNNLKEIKFKRIFLSGGEPILDKHFFKYLDISKKISDEVFLCSNGTLLTNKMLEKLSDSGVKGIIVSLQTLENNKSMEIYQRPNIPNIVLDALNRIKKYNFMLGIEMTIFKNNYYIIDDLINVVKKYGIKSISFKRLMEVGRGKVNNLGLTPEENYKVLKKIFNIQKANTDVHINVHDPLYGTIIYDHYKNNNYINSNIINGYSCRAGTRWIGMDPYGNISPCPLMLYQDVIIGNIFECNLIDILENSTLIKQFQEISIQEESSCEYGTSCLGCRVAALSKANNLFAKDPMCIHENFMCPSCLSKS